MVTTSTHNADCNAVDVTNICSSQIEAGGRSTIKAALGESRLGELDLLCGAVVPVEGDEGLTLKVGAPGVPGGDADCVLVEGLERNGGGRRDDREDREEKGIK